MLGKSITFFLSYRKIGLNTGLVFLQSVLFFYIAIFPMSSSYSCKSQLIHCIISKKKYWGMPAWTFRCIFTSTNSWLTPGILIQGKQSPSLVQYFWTMMMHGLSFCVFGNYSSSPANTCRTPVCWPHCSLLGSSSLPFSLLAWWLWRVIHMASWLSHPGDTGQALWLMFLKLPHSTLTMVMVAGMERRCSQLG